MINISRRLFAILYDVLILASLIFFITFSLIIMRETRAVESENLLFQVFLFFMPYLYFCWHWVHGGQTLGMKAWRIRLINQQGEVCNWKQASWRFLYAQLSWLTVGLVFVVGFFEPEKRLWYDKFSRTTLEKIS